MSNTKNTITINGKTYDARTGALINHTAVVTPTKPQVFQDVLGPIIITPNKVVTHKPVTPPKPAREHHATEAKKIHSANQKAATLMRGVVHKPLVTPKATPAHHAVYSDDVIQQPKRLKATHSNPRADRAKEVHQSKLISKFNLTQIPTVTKKAEPLAVKQSPIPLAAHISTPKPLTVTHSAQPSPVDDLFTRAIAHADSHTKPQHVKSKRRHRVASRLGVSAVTLNIGTSLLIVAILAVFFKLHTMPQTAMNNAAKQAGISARLPQFAPSGFSMGKPASPTAGKVVINFHSNSDQRNYSISQEKTALDSEALRSDVVAATQQEYQTYESSGKTIYLYNDSNATWVNNGLRYTIEGNSSLTPDQVLRIAASF